MDFEDEEFIKREQSDDLLFEAYEEPVKSKAIKLAKQALEVNPDNIDAENFITKFETKIKVKKLIFVCGFNNYLGIDEEYDAVNESMYLDNLQDVKQYADEIIGFYSDNDPYVKYEVEKEFVDTVATEKILMPKAGHINSESGYDTFEEIVSYL